MQALSSSGQFVVQENSDKSSTKKPSYSFPQCSSFPSCALFSLSLSFLEECVPMLCWLVGPSENSAGSSSASSGASSLWNSLVGGH